MATGKGWTAAEVRVGEHALCWIPALLWLNRIRLGQLGADPVAELTHASGDWALRFLLLCLAMTPLRRVTGHTGPIRYRRMLGLYAFAYASAHFAVYLVLDLGGYWPQIFEDLRKRPYIMVGFAAWLGMLPLALTSTRAAMRALGRRWGQLHRLVYVCGVCAVVHFWWLVKADLREPLLYAGILLILLGARLVSRWTSGRKASHAG